MQAAERAKRREPEERLAEALNAAAFVVHGYEQRRLANRVQFRDELRDLLAALEVAREEDHAADERRLEPCTLVVGYRRASQVDHQGSERHVHSSSSKRTRVCYAISTRVPVGTSSKSSTRPKLPIRTQPIDPGTPSAVDSGVPWM